MLTRPQPPAPPVALDPIAAAGELRDAVVRTPVRRLAWLERLVGVPVWAKLENQQHTGSFKYRGAHLAVSRSTPDTPLIAASAGNHGLAVAEVAHRLGRTANICIPVTASRLKRERILATGAGLIEHGSSLEEAISHAAQLASARQLYHISPYSDPNVIDGASTVALELLTDVPDVTTMIVPVGGGGLAAGMALGAQALGRTVRLVGCEPERYGSMTASLMAGGIVQVPHRPTLADGLAANLEPGAITFALAQRHLAGTVTLSEEELAAATLALLIHESLLVEPAGAAAVAACLRLARNGQLTTPVGIPLTGGNLQHANLSRVQRFPYRDPDLVRLLDLRGRSIADTPVVRVRPTSGTDGEPAASAAGCPDPAKEAWPGPDLAAQLRQCAEDLRAAVELVDEFAGYCDSTALVTDVTVLGQLTATGRAALDRVEAARQELGYGEPAGVATTRDPDRLAIAESVLRFGLATLAHVRGALEWCSPSYTQAGVAQFFDITAQDAPTVNYERYESPAARQVEEQLVDVLGLAPDRQAALATSSGMAAYSLIEAFLIRYRLAPGDTVLLAPYIYFEASEQLTSLPGVRCVRSSGHDVEQMLAAVAHHRPRCVFVDPIANTARQEAVDIPAFLSRLAQQVDRPTTVVVDGTMVSGALAGTQLAGRDQVEVLYYESCSKYLQLGLDAAMAGVVVCTVDERARFERLRRNTGTILSRHNALLFPRFDRAHFRRRMSRICGNARRIAGSLIAVDALRDIVEVFYPGHPAHPDAAATDLLPYAGGCVTFLFRDPGRNHRDQLEGLQEQIFGLARARGLQLTKGVSFGFSAPRVSAAASMAESEPPFLRLYAGDRGPDQVAILAEVTADALRT